MTRVALLPIAIACMAWTAPAQAGITMLSISVGPGSSFSPADANIPSEFTTTARWSWQGGTHTVTATGGPAFFDSGTQSTPFSFDAQLKYKTQPGQPITYVCEVHAPVMAGTITVTGDGLPFNQDPLAAITGPTTAGTGAPVTFDASGSTDELNSIVRYRWDLDGNGSFEVNTGTTPTVDTTYSTPGARLVKVEVMDDGRGTNSATHSIEVTGPALAPPPPPGPPPPGPPPPLGAPPPPADTVKPRLSALRINPSSFCVKRSRTCRTPGTRVRFRLSERADVTMEVFYLGATASKRRVKTIRLRGRRAGTHVIRYSGTGLKRGRYVLNLFAQDAARNVSKSASARFSVRR